MAPGRKPSARAREPAETPLTDYERLRAQNMMKNNQMFQRLGLSTLASMINNTSSKSKDDVSQQSGSLYDAQDSEGFEQEEVSKVHRLLQENKCQGEKVLARGWIHYAEGKALRYQSKFLKGREDQSHLFRRQSLHRRVGSYSSSTYQSIHIGRITRRMRDKLQTTLANLLDNSPWTSTVRQCMKPALTC
ncbi:uncharacterized protein LOC120685593 [Panicum virgatum]|uniref:uncharacterized protein LOC120685593 n=1 Tax=Panicum virgatum TaxID=38727 RepID=UPI0019D63DF6|nr:uncharacterized protein LOC120685593 [Panicum virgatum]